MFVAIFVSICKFQLCKKLFQIIVLPSFYGDTYAKEMTRVNDNESNMTNVYMSQLIVTEVQKGKTCFYQHTDLQNHPVHVTCIMFLT